MVRNGVLQQIKSRDIQVGDIVKLADGEQVNTSFGKDCLVINLCRFHAICAF